MPEEQEKIEPTKPSAWKKEEEVDLPSGNVVRFRFPTLYVWLKTGQLSKETTAAYRQAADEKAKPLTLDEKQAAIAEVLCKCVVEPPWSLTPREDALCIDEVCDQDKTFLAMRLMVGL